MNIKTKTLLYCGTALMIGCAMVVANYLPERHSTLTEPAPLEQHAEADMQSVTVEEAQQEIQRLLRRRTPLGKSGSYLAGINASMNGDHKHAAHYLTAVVNDGQADDRILALAIRHQLLAGQVDDAINLVQEAKTDTSEGNRYIPLLKTIAALKQDTLKEAQEHAASLKPVGVHQLFVPFIEQWLAYGTPKQASFIASQDVLAHGYFKSLHHYHQALQHELRQDKVAAASAYETALSELRSAPEAVVVAAVRFYQAEGNHKRALAIIEAYRDLYPRIALWNMADNTTYAEKLPELHTAIVKNPADGIAEALANIGTLLVKEGAQEEGQGLLRLSLYLRPDDILTQMALAESLEHSDRHNDAIAAYRMMELPEWLQDIKVMYLARVYHARGDSTTAREMLQGLRGNTHATYNLNVMLGDLERVEKNYSKAAEYYSKAVASIEDVKSSDWPLIYRRGIMYDLSGQWEKAEADFRHALELEPDEPQILNYLGYSWLMRDERFDEAAEILRKAVSSSPYDAHIIDSYGWALYKLGRYEKALEKLEEALSMIPSDPTINDHYGDVLWRLGRDTEARYHWQRALLFNPTEPGAKEALESKLQHGLNTATAPKTRHSDAR